MMETDGRDRATCQNPKEGTWMANSVVFFKLSQKRGEESEKNIKLGFEGFCDF